LRSIVKLLQKFRHKKSLGCYIISHKPVIVISYWQDFYYRNRDAVIAKMPKKNNSYILFQIGYYKSKKAVEEILGFMQQLRSQNSKVNYVFLNNTLEEHNYFLEAGLKSVFTNQNAFLDEKRYKILPWVKKKYDALYLARMTPVKRHELAKNIKSLRVIGSYYDKEMEYVDFVRKSLPQAKWTMKVPHAIISYFVNQAKIGLALSDVEGAMFVSTEYFLCGLAQVSTPSVGGRDIYFDEEFTIIVPPEEQAIAKATKELIDRNIDPQLIREKTILKMKEHRQYFIDFIQSIFDAENVDKKFDKMWDQIFTHKMALRIHSPRKLYNTRILKEETFFEDDYGK